MVVKNEGKEYTGRLVNNNGTNQATGLHSDCKQQQKVASKDQRSRKKSVLEHLRKGFEKARLLVLVLVHSIPVRRTVWGLILDVDKIIYNSVTSGVPYGI
jgi:hypothetical protein